MLKKNIVSWVSTILNLLCKHKIKIAVKIETRLNIYKQHQLCIPGYLIVETATDKQKQITHKQSFCSNIKQQVYWGCITDNMPILHLKSRTKHRWTCIVH